MARIAGVDLPREKRVETDTVDVGKTDFDSLFSG